MFVINSIFFVWFSGDKPHKCRLCDFRCRDESYLSKHMLTHLEDKNFMCAECGYVTRWKHYLTVHMRKHAGDLRYETTLGYISSPVMMQLQCVLFHIYIFYWIGRG